MSRIMRLFVDNTPRRRSGITRRRRDSSSCFAATTRVVSTWLSVTSVPKVIWEEGRVASHAYSIKSPLVTMARPKSTPSPGLIPKLHYVPHPWTRPTYDAKRHPDPIRRFSTMHWTDRRTDRQIVHEKVWWPIGRRYVSNESDAA